MTLKNLNKDIVVKVIYDIFKEINRIVMYEIENLKEYNICGIKDLDTDF